METYSFLRELADSWVLLALTVFFLGTIVWAFRPGSRTLHDDVADIPFRNETAQSTDPEAKS
jgi:cytochrome c oxidase cbb3-type subunit 4